MLTKTWLLPICLVMATTCTVQQCQIFAQRYLLLVAYMRISSYIEKTCLKASGCHTALMDFWRQICCMQCIQDHFSSLNYKQMSLAQSIYLYGDEGNEITHLSFGLNPFRGGLIFGNANYVGKKLCINTSMNERYSIT